MKPKTKLEYKVVAANGQLQPIGQGPVDWAFKHCVEHMAFRTPSGMTTCMDCGHQWQNDTNNKHCRCPHCYTTLEIKDTLRRNYKEKIYFSVIDIQDDLQLQRVFRFDVTFHKKKKPTQSLMEVARVWIDENGNTEVTGLRRTMGCYMDSFAWNSELELRQYKEAYLYIADCYTYPKCRVIPKLIRNGLKKSFFDIAPQRLMSALLTDSRIETLLKVNDITALRHFVMNMDDLNFCWASYKIVLRNGYHITDIQMWVDYIRMLARNGNDIHNAHYVCPTNLKKEHDKVRARLNGIKEREERERQRIVAMADEAAFEEMKRKFFGLSFTDGIIVISVLDSVDAYYQEGNALHHCVGQCKYYKRPNSLVLSARIDGERIETVELSLETFKVLQSRGICNGNSPYHDAIINLVQKNVGLVMERMTA